MGPADYNTKGLGGEVGLIKLPNVVVCGIHIEEGIL